MHVSEERQEVTAAFLTKGSNGFQLDILISRMLLLWAAVCSDMLTEWLSLVLVCFFRVGGFWSRSWSYLHKMPPWPNIAVPSTQVSYDRTKHDPLPNWEDLVFSCTHGPGFSVMNSCFISLLEDLFLTSCSFLPWAKIEGKSGLYVYGTYSLHLNYISTSIGLTSTVPFLAHGPS